MHVRKTNFQVLKSFAVAIVGGKMSGDYGRPTQPTPPEPGLGYLCLLLVKLETKKFLSPERRLIALTGRLAGPDRWQAPFFFIYLCCVSESEPSNASTCHLSTRSDSAFIGLFRLKNPARQRAPPSSCSVVLLKKDLCPGEDSRPEEGR